MQNTLIGIDLVEVKRFASFDFKSKFAENIFSDRELKDFEKTNKSTESLAGRFAAKEAVKKTLDENVKLNIIEVLYEKNGRPFICFLNNKLNKKYNSKISITHTNTQAIAVCFTQINYENEPK